MTSAPLRKDTSWHDTYVRVKCLDEGRPAGFTEERLKLPFYKRTPLGTTLNLPPSRCSDPVLRIHPGGVGGEVSLKASIDPEGISLNCSIGLHAMSGLSCTVHLFGACD